MNLSTSIRNMTLIAMVTAMLCLLGPLAIPLPFSPVPLSLATLGLYLTAYILNTKNAILCCTLYLFMGLIGLPIFSGYSGGVGKLFGPTGGYILGYLPLTIICVLFFKHTTSKWMHIVGMILGTLILYLFGTLWLSYIASISISVAFLIGVLPYIIGDIIKIMLATKLSMHIHL